MKWSPIPKSWTRLVRRSWRDLLAHTGGVAAIEFALVVPLVIIVYAGGFEIVQAATVNRKLTDTTVQLANVTTQYTAVGQPDLANIFAASSQMQRINLPYLCANMCRSSTQLSGDWYSQPITLPVTRSTSLG